jgi:bifunctional DNA-binding transcriptional regulator/antitoxin component of YhaV-PrlF toxin-antitoxin module
MKLQLIKTMRGNAVYEKFQVVLPRKIVEDAGWHEKDEIEFDVDRKGRVIMSGHEPQPKPRKLTYDEAREALFFLLHSTPYGLSYCEIHAKAPALPIKPSSHWVTRLEIDIGLRRYVDKKTGRKIWLIPSQTTSSNDVLPTVSR